MRRPLWDRIGFQGAVMFALSFIIKCGLLIWKNVDVNSQVSIWDFMMGMFLMMALIGDWEGRR
jgi:hypothetical protein